MNHEKLDQHLEVYKREFREKIWPQEKHKWQAVKHFQDHWDIEAEDFSAMWREATAQAHGVLDHLSPYTRTNIRDYIREDPEYIREAFRALYDESQNFQERVDDFIQKMDFAKAEFHIGKNIKWGHNPNSTSIYLWLRYPDKYSVYQYNEIKEVMQYLGSKLKPLVGRKGRNGHVLRVGYSLYAGVQEVLLADPEVRQMLEEAIDDSCYPDPNLTILTQDLIATIHSHSKLQNGKMRGSASLTWIPFNTELANTILEYKERRTDLKELIAPVLDSEQENINPFSIFAWINSSNDLSWRIEQAEMIKNVLDLESDTPRDFDGIPTYESEFDIFQLSENDQKRCIDLLWDVFSDAIHYADEPSEDYQLGLRGNSSSLAEGMGLGNLLSNGLYWVRPYHYVPLDSTIERYIGRRENTSQKLAKALSTDASSSGMAYLQLCEQILDLCELARTPYDDIPSMCMLAYGLQSSDQSYGEQQYQADDSVLSVELWKELLKDPDILDTSHLQLLRQMYEYDKPVTASELAYRYGGPYQAYSARLASAGRKAADAFDLAPDVRPNGETRWWTILCKGRYKTDGGEGVFEWYLKPELRVAIEQTDLSHIPLEFDADEIYTLQDEYDIADLPESYTRGHFLSEVYMDPDSYDALVNLLNYKKNVILQGPPGTGKTFAARRLAYSLIGEKRPEQVEFVQFHQSYGYEEFIMGYKPMDEGFRLEEGVFYDFCRRAGEDPQEDYYFIIDEINRGNLSKIFGELLMLIENSYRGPEHQVRLAYNKEEFHVPTNVYIIGTMNTADRSLALIDYALRRRFSFFDMKPGFETKGFEAYAEGLNSEVFTTLIHRIIALNDTISSDVTLGEGFCIGHSYLCNHNGLENPEPRLRNIVDYELIPMLNEYWFDNSEKAQGEVEQLRKVFND